MATLNTVRDRLSRNELVLGLNVRHSKTSEIGAILHDCGYHWLMLDDEHSPVAVHEAYQISLGAIRAGVTPFARVRSHDPWEIGRHLSNGALGVFVPHVENETQAEAVSRACRFAPRGTQSVAASFPQLGYRRLPAPEATGILNRETTVVVMLESAEAVANADKIAQVEEADVLFIGCTDLTYDLGIPGQYGDERVLAAVDRVCRAARDNGKAVGLGGPTDALLWKRFIGLGVRMVMTENDLNLLIARATERTQFFAGLIKG